MYNENCFLSLMRSWISSRLGEPPFVAPVITIRPLSGPVMMRAVSKEMNEKRNGLKEE